MIAVLAVVGMCGSGKSEASAHLAQKGLPRVHFGGITMEEVRRRGLLVSEANERMVREELRQRHGMAAYAILSLPKIRALVAEGRSVLIDGLYSDAELKVLQEEFPGQVFVLGVFTDKRLRYARLAARPARPLTPEEAASRDRMEVDHLEKAPPIALADAMVLNNGTVEELRAAVDAVVDPLIVAGELRVEKA
ncbi:MAG: AAA family ATPase [Armatimonadetes bacterium]|nr:AAA family ATPase [Armatimonadota bacterium]